MVVIVVVVKVLELVTSVDDNGAGGDEISMDYIDISQYVHWQLKIHKSVCLLDELKVNNCDVTISPFQQPTAAQNIGLPP